MRISSQATEYLRALVTVDGATPPPSDLVHFAFLAAGWPVPSTTWHVGAWVDGKARILVGPGAGGLVVPLGSYRVFLRVTDNPEIPIDQVGQLTIY
ncbi:hypothetical protein [Alloactinosynnema sp. L-07]|uniref:hypothetical protein n=1 Tax=Alloactinosynnema sp. L-07 TaxID=1653480 RepID=UPI00065F0718|nr:hypothetical protein [Alloactinosynnema sp. L-07]CRK59092.1 hypothetical protein [Alloactinosynnema sp. L-07]